MIPIGIMYYFGHPDFYNHKVRPVALPGLPFAQLTHKLNFWPKPEDQPIIPHDRTEMVVEVQRLKQERLKRREDRLRREKMERPNA